MLTISKDKSIVIKGIVIVMMVFLHLFNDNHTDMCVNLLFVGGVPLAKWLSNACNPVDYFLLLSGYGLAYTYEHKGLYFIQQVKRIFKLYVHYWPILLIFVFLGILIKPESYPGSWNLISFGNAMTYMIYVPLMVILFGQMSFPRWIECILMELGRKSMPIWLIHTWYCYYLFQPQIYSLKHPILILGGTILISYLTAIPVMWMAKRCFNILGI